MRSKISTKIWLALISKANFRCGGSGDTFYDEFCKAVDDFDRCFAATGAEKALRCQS